MTASPRTITIAGGGLAGLSLGIALRQREVPVRIVEAGSYPRHRVCGEFVSGITDKELDALGILDLFAGAPRHRSTVWYEGTNTMLRTGLPEPAIGISRHYLDDAMARRLEALGGEVVTGSRFVAQRENRTRSLEGEVLATGRPRRESQWVGLKAHYRNLPLQADLEVHLAGRSYVGLTPVEDGSVNVCGLFRRSRPLDAAGQPGNDRGRRAMLSLAAREAGLEELAQRLDAAQVDTPSIKGVNQFLLGWQPRQRDEELRVGDQAAMIPPFTGNGMTMAFQSALTAVEPLAAWSAGRSPWREVVRQVRARQRRAFARRLRWSWLLHGLLLTRTGRSACRGVLNRGWVSFDQLYHLVR